MRGAILLAVLLLPPRLCDAAAPLPVETYNLEDAVRLALRNDAELQSAEQDITIARQRVREAEFQFYPEVGLQAIGTRYNSNYPFALRPNFGSALLFPSQQDFFYSGQAYMTLSLYEGQRTLNTLRLAQKALKQAESKYEAVKMDIVFNTKRVFHRLILFQELQAAMQRLSAGVKSMSESAKPALSERIDAEVLASELRAEESSILHEADLARLDLLKGLNRELDTPVAVEGKLETKPVEVDLKQALVWATELRPELQSQTYKAQMDAIAVNLALERRIPTLQLGLDYDLNGQNFPIKQNNWDATIGLKIPFNFDYWTQHTEKLAEQRQGEIARAELHDRIHLEVRKAYKDLLYWQEEYPVRERDFQRVRELFDSLLRSGSRNAGSLGSALRLVRVQRSYLEAVIEHILSRARLERAIGRALPER